MVNRSVPGSHAPSQSIDDLAPDHVLPQDWLVPESPPSAALARCKVCKRHLVLLLQLNGELPDRFPGHERRLYVFACRNQACRRKEGSVRVLRGARIAATQPMTTAIGKDEDIDMTGTGPDSATGPTTSPAPVKSNLGETIFGASSLGSGPLPGANPFSTKANPFSTAPSSQPANPFSTTTKVAAPAAASAGADKLPQTFAAALSLNNPTPKPTVAGPTPPPEPWPAPSLRPRAYPALYLADVEYETLDPTITKQQQNRVQYLGDGDEGVEDGGSSSGSSKKAATAGSSSSTEKEAREAFETEHMDTVFQRFADRLAQNPEQVVRYEFGSRPLLCSRTDAVGKLLQAPGSSGSATATQPLPFPRCPNCGAPRVFECQLMPHAIAELEGAELEERGDVNLLEEGMEWVTIVVAVCERDCQLATVQGPAEAGYLEEWAGVQWEELKKR